MNLAKAPWGGEKILKLSIVWTLFTIVSLIVAHSFLAYFVGAERLVEMTQHNPRENWTVFLIMAFSFRIKFSSCLKTNYKLHFLIL